jgi:hypothetical protein
MRNWSGADKGLVKLIGNKFCLIWRVAMADSLEHGKAVNRGSQLTVAAVLRQPKTREEKQQLAPLPSIGEINDNPSRPQWKSTPTMPV